MWKDGGGVMGRRPQGRDRIKKRNVFRKSQAEKRGERFQRTHPGSAPPVRAPSVVEMERRRILLPLRPLLPETKRPKRLRTLLDRIRRLSLKAEEVSKLRRIKELRALMRRMSLKIEEIPGVLLGPPRLLWPSDDPRLSVIMGTWNRLEVLKRCLAAVRQSVMGISYEIIVVDGGSTDGTLEWLSTQTDVVTVRQGRLVGACRAYNAGFRLARAPFTIHVNDDDLVQGDCLALAYKYMIDHPTVGQMAFAFDLWGPGVYKHDVVFNKEYANKGITWREAGDQAGWWTELFYTYGGDCELSCRIRESNWDTTALLECQVHDLTTRDKLREVNNPNGANPDSENFYALRKGVDPSTPRRKILHVALNHGKDNQPALQRALRSLGEYRQIDWMVAGKDLSRRLIAEVGDWRPDLVFMQIQSGGVIDIDTISQIKNLDATVVNWSGDVRDPMPTFYSEIGPALDWMLLTNEDWVKTLRKRGTNAAYLQIGFNQELFHPWGSGIQAEPIVFLANYYGNAFPMSKMRLEMVRHLTQKYDLGVYGNGWLVATHAQLDWQLEVGCYRSCKIAVGMNQIELERYTSDRLFRAMGSGAFYLAHYYPGIEKDFERGVHLDWWYDLDELSAKVDYYLEHDEERCRIAAAGSELVHTHHTWLDRMKELRKILGWHEWK